MDSESIQSPTGTRESYCRAINWGGVKFTLKLNVGHTFLFSRDLADCALDLNGAVALPEVYLLTDHDHSDDQGPDPSSQAPARIPLQLVIRMLTKQVIHVEAFASDTVLDLKILLQETVGYPADQLKLIFTHQDSGPLLEDSDTLAECGIMDGSELYLIISVRGGYYPHLMPKEPETVKLSIRIRRGKCVVVNARRSETVGSVKHSIENQAGLPVAQQVLRYCGEDMSDEKTLAHYDIRDRCIVYLSTPTGEDKGSRGERPADASKGLFPQIRHAIFLIRRLFL